MCDADVLDAESTFEGLEICERGTVGVVVAAGGEGEEIWFEDVLVGVPCSRGDKLGGVGWVHFG